jgi:hypothetical protein
VYSQNHILEKTQGAKMPEQSHNVFDAVEQKKTESRVVSWGLVKELWDALGMGPHWLGDHTNVAAWDKAITEVKRLKELDNDA